jgi:arylsulfatase A-like enzyme
MRIVFTVLDALPARHVGPDHTPVLDDLARVGGRAAIGARAVMTSATYPNHATFVTGTDPVHHGIGTNWVPETRRVMPAWERGPDGRTLFDACRDAGRTTAAVFGDQHLVGVTGARAADHHWPPDGVPPDGCELDAMGYLDDGDTVRELVRLLDDGPDLVVSQINGPDTAAHLFGPDSAGALEGYRATDAWLAVAREHVAWDDTIWILVSDHDQETVTEREPIDLQREIASRGLALLALPEGNASLLCGDGAHDAGAWISEVPGIEGSARFTVADATLDCLLVWAEPGRAFGFAGTPTRHGTHGGPRTRSQVAVVTGGHPAVAPLARAVESTSVGAADWAPTIAALLGLDLVGATGRALSPR